jgi:hypothetical protein
MSHTLKLEIPESLFVAIKHQAAMQGSDPATLAASTLRERFGSPPRVDGDKEADKDKVEAFRAMFGADRGPATGLDNEEIDAQLANEYARGLSD